MFELLTVTQVSFTNVHTWPEFHGEDRVRAIAIAMTVEGGNQLLDAIEPGLLVHHYTNRAAAAGQDKLPELIAALPNLRFPKLPTSYRYAKDDKPRGYTLEIDFGLGDRNIVLEDCVRGSLSYEIQEGGSVKIDVSMQYNGHLLDDNELLGRLCGLAGEGSGHILLQAPVQPIMVKGKGWRSGKPDAPVLTDGGAPLLGEAGAGPADGPNNEGDGDRDDHPEGTPEEALAAAVAADAKPKSRRGLRGVAA